MSHICSRLRNTKRAPSIQTDRPCTQKERRIRMNVMMTGRRRCALALLLAALVLEGLLAEQVDVSHGAIVQAGRHNTGTDRRAELDFQLFQNLEVVRIFKVRFGHEHHAGLVVFQCQFIGLFCADGHAAAARHAHQHALGGADALVLACFKVEQARCIDQVVLDALVLHRHNGRRQAGLALCFLRVKVRNRGAVLDPAHTLGSARKIDQCLGQRRFAGVGVADDSKRPAALDFFTICHKSFVLLRCGPAKGRVDVSANNRV